MRPEESPMRTNKKLATLCAISALTLASLTGCGSNETDKTTASAPATTAAAATATPEATKAPTTEAAKLQDGTFTKTATEAHNGYFSEMKMVVKDGKITELTWDAKDEKGNKKSKLALEGKYVMTETGLTWDVQAKKLADYVIKNQSVKDLTTDKDGKTDVIAGVSISITDFIEYTTELMEKSANK